jgi:hypothetical protein
VPEDAGEFWGFILCVSRVFVYYCDMKLADTLFAFAELGRMKLFILLLILTLPLQTLACACRSPETIADVQSPSIVFKGRVVSIQKFQGTGDPVHIGSESVFYFSTQEITFDLLTQHQGPKMRRITVSFNEAGSTSCDLEKLSFNKGDTYLISTLLPKSPKSKDFKRRASNPYTNNFCNLRKKLSAQSK